MYRSTFESRGVEFFNHPVPRVIKILLLVNIGIFALQFLLESFGAPAGLFRAYLALQPDRAVEDFYVWQFLTYAYVHSANPWHILINMLMLWMFGCELATYYGPRRFLLFYHVSAFVGGVVQVIAAYVQNTTANPILGASGAIYGIFVVYAMLFPNRQILLFFLIPIRMKYFILILVAVDFVSGTRFLNAGIAYFCHLGGALGGFLFHRLHGRVETFFGRMEERIEARDAAREAEVRQTVDQLLEKIRREGIHKLTPKEKRFLNHASKLYQKEDPFS